ncbi:ATP-binding cassette domain-containing protein [Croceibacterium sp. LX-88]|uniref:ATP-binding cassette domain-containing protein n=1 Tax=Croceibacterium selenioxidans TaxID=2838833 RepID=A0ABS5W8A0_9SPHN|nr:ABC-F family ATP-binding cassette domain-containing protein [Croceibacterium selenioxidans]MBT2135884.1 ATP-binding cassette domain-containing protein [Croceibacterium selenioxidans]
MSAFLTLDSVSAQTPEHRVLFQGLTLAIGAERVGLVGRNGSGKSTLLRIIAGMADAATGTVRRSGTIGMLVQDWPPDLSLADALGVAEGMAVLQRVLAGDGNVADFEAADWALGSRVDSALADAGVPGFALDRTMGSLSGGERTRVGIARLLIEKPDLLLLDEPTNNLDSAGREAIHSLIRGWSGGALVASHDRELLETMDRIVELTSVGVHIVGGGWTAFATQREAERSRVTQDLERSEAALREVERSAQRQREAKDRRDKAGRAFAAKGSEPKILLGAKAERAENSGGRGRRLGERFVNEAAARAEEAIAKVEVLTPLTISLPPSGIPSGAQILALEEVAVDLGERRLGPWTLSLRGPERVAVSGPNGAGKTTLLKIAAGLALPSSGTVCRLDGRIAILDQHVTLLDPEASILANFRRLNPSLNVRDAYAACARFAFRNRDAEQLVGTLSGGERLRAGLACTLAGERPPWLLILDEPTNHLDLASIELLEQALREFDGALLIVSHDPAFLKAVGMDREFGV